MRETERESVSVKEKREWEWKREKESCCLRSNRNYFLFPITETLTNSGPQTLTRVMWQGRNERTPYINTHTRITRIFSSFPHWALRKIIETDFRIKMIETSHEFLLQHSIVSCHERKLNHLRCVMLNKYSVLHGFWSLLASQLFWVDFDNFRRELYFF